MFDSQGNFINPGLVTQDIGQVLASNAISGGINADFLSQYIPYSTNSANAGLIESYLPWLLVAGAVAVVIAETKHR